MITPILRRKALVIALASVFAHAGIVSADPRAVVPAEVATPQSIDATLANPSLLMFRAGSYDPTVQRLDLSATANPSATSTRYAIVQFHADTLDAGRRALQAQGIEMLGYVPNNAYFVRLNGKSLDAVKANPSVRAAEFHSAGLKIDPRLWSTQRSLLLQQTPQDATSEAELLDIVDIRGFAGESSEVISATLRKLVPGVRITLRSMRADAPPYVHAGVPRNQLDALLQAASAIDGVAYIEPWFPTRLHNAGGVGAIQGNATAACPGNGAVCGPAPLWAQGILGSNQIVAVADSGTTPWAAWFTTLDKGAGPLTQITLSDNPPPVLPAVGNLYPNRKIVGYWLQPLGPVDYDYASGHGTHTSGTVAGDAAGTFGATTYLASTPSAANHELADGMAPNAQLILQDIGGTAATAVYMSDFTGTLKQAYDGGARIHNNSWGAPTAGIYSGNDAEADAVTWADEGLLVVVSAGNDDPGPTQTGTPSNAKNVVSIGALNHAGSTVVPAYSNRGPAADGRIKPDLTAPGSGVISALNGPFSAVPTQPNSISNSGTSMSAPTISGNAALLRQYFTDGFYPRGERTTADAMAPTGALLKAALINSTNPLGAPTWPNAATGWGRPWLDGNLWFKTTLGGGNDARRMRVFERTQAAGLKTGGTHDYTIANVVAGQELRVTLAWFDPEAAAGAAVALVNNLDLEVVAPDSTVYKGNVFTSGVSTSGGTADARNTVEQVRLTAPASGNYTLRVKATAIPGNGRSQSNVQGYALVASGAFGLPDAAPVAAPSAPTIASNDTNGIAVGFGGTAPQGFQLYRATGTCATANAAEFHLVASGTASPLLDTTSQGGFGYAYKVRGIGNDVEGTISTCVDAVSADECTLQPSITLAGLVADGSNASCAVSLTWPAATLNCPAAGPVTYSVTRSTEPFFTNPTVVASNLASPSFTDTNVVNGTAYFYRFSATDAAGNASSASNLASVTTSGAPGPDPVTFFDNAEGVAWLNAELPWGFSTIAAADGTHSYHTGGQASNHPDLTCASIETPALTIPANGRVNFSARYNLEYQWDGVVTEISTNGGTTWTDLPPDGGYPTTFNTGQNPPINSCGFADGKGIYSGVTTTTSNAFSNNDTGVAIFKPFSINLASFAGQSVKIRWRLSSDPGLNYSGFFLDQVRVGNVDIVFRNGFDFDQYMCQ